MSLSTPEIRNSSHYGITDTGANDDNGTPTMFDLSSCIADNIDSVDSFTTNPEENINSPVSRGSSDTIGFDQLEAIINGSIGHLTELTPMTIEEDLSLAPMNVSASSEISSSPSILGNLSVSSSTNGINTDLNSLESWEIGNMVIVLSMVFFVFNI